MPTVSQRDSAFRVRASVPEMSLLIRGRVPPEAVGYARQKIGRVAEQVPLPVLFVRVRLIQYEDRSRDRPAVVEAALDVNGHVVRAHRAGYQFYEAVDLTEQRLRDRLWHLADRQRTRARDPGVVGPGQWRHQGASAARPAYVPRPPEEREVVRRKALPLGESTVDEAAFDMELLDHDFYLFREVAAAGDSLLVRDAGHHRLLRTGGAPAIPPGVACDLDRSPVPDLADEQAIERMDAGHDPFVFYRDVRSGRGHVVYRRYDGHYGILEPADA